MFGGRRAALMSLLLVVLSSSPWKRSGSSSSSSILASAFSRPATSTIAARRRGGGEGGAPILLARHDQPDGRQRLRLAAPSRLSFRSRLYSSSSSSLSSSSSAEATTTAAASAAESTISSSSSPPRIKTIDINASDHTPAFDSSLVKIQGWVRTIRKQKTTAFIQVNDGSNLAGIQCVVSLSSEQKQEESDDDTENDSTGASSSSIALSDLDQVTTGAAVEIIGRIVQSAGGQQALEVAATSLRVVGTCPADAYPLAKKRHSLEYLRLQLAHLRPRTNTIAAVARVRSRLAGYIHAFFQQERFVYVQTPLITTSDCEGAGELFRVTTLDLDNVSKLPRVQADKRKPTMDGDSDKKSAPTSDAVDYAQDFFGKAAFLTVSGQLGGETYATALGDIYTFGPTFRAENSQTTRHLAEFHMVEPEMAFCDLQGAMDNAEAMLKYVVGNVLENCREDLDFFAQFYDKQLLDRLQRVADEPFARISYRQAIEYLQEEIAKDPTKWQFPEVEFGTDLATEHERWLAETKFQSAVFVYNYPKAIKAFYMRDNDEDAGQTVQAMDLLVPGVGELIGGSQREERLDVLVQKLKDCDLNPDDYWWYLDLRRYGSVPHSGYGLGFERLVTYVCGLENIRDAIAYPRYPGNAEF